MKSKKIIKDALALFVITLVSGLFLGFVFEITKEPIAEQKAIAKQRAYQQVFPKAAAFQESKELTGAAANAVSVLEAAGYSGITIDEALPAKDSAGEMLGYVMTITTKNGYGSAITITCGEKLDGTITGIEFLSISETAGLGMKAKEPAFKEQFTAMQEEKFTVTKSGKTSDDQIDAISGATITSDAVTEAVNAGIHFIDNFSVNESTVHTGASGN